MSHRGKVKVKQSRDAVFVLATTTLHTRPNRRYATLELPIEVGNFPSETESVDKEALKVS